MDDIVKQAMHRWPDVPHCYGWLMLDARGAWRMRDERAQALGLPGDKINHPALLGFIARNYTHDERGCWYFQNGPQRVFVNLAATPYIARTEPAQGFILHTGEPLAMPDSAWMTEDGSLIVTDNEKIAKIDDRDIAECLTCLRLNGNPVEDERLLAWLRNGNDPAKLMLETASRRVPVQRLAVGNIAAHFGFNPAPSARSGIGP